MKNNKVLIIIGIVLLNVLAVYMIGQAFLGQASEYDIQLEKARTYYEQDLCVKAVQSYQAALEEKSSVALYAEMLTAYERGLENGEYANNREAISVMEEMVEAFREDPAAYELACGYLIKNGKFEDCAKLFKQAENLYVFSDKLTELLNTMRYEHELDHTVYTELSSPINGSYLGQVDGVYHLLNTGFSKQVSGNYDYASSFSEGYAFVRIGAADSDYLSFVVDKAGVRQFYLPGVTESSGVGKGLDAAGEAVLLLAGLKDGKYSYYNMQGQVAFGEYVFAGRFRNNVAAVQEKKGEWKLINAAGQPVTNTVFEDVILNEFDECAAKGMIFAKKDGKYRLYNALGQPVGDFTCDMAKPFVDTCAAFKDGDTWGFVNNKGEVVIQPQYEDAKSFNAGLAGVRVGDVWGFIDESNTMVIAAEYEEAGYFTAAGKCTVRINGTWSFMTMYYTAD